MPNANAVIEEFSVVCTSARNDYDLYRAMFVDDHSSLSLYDSVAPLSFHDIERILKANIYIQFCAITDCARTGKKFNLTTNYIEKELQWPDAVGKKLQAINERLMAFRALIEPARSKRIAHVDLHAQIEQWDNLGVFPEGGEEKFLQDLQDFINIAYGYLNQGGHRPITAAMSTDAHQLVRALTKSAVFDRCSRCSASERAIAVLDYEL